MPRISPDLTSVRWPSKAVESAAGTAPALEGHCKNQGTVSGQVFLACGIALLIVFQSGCQVFNRFRSVGPAAPVRFVASPSQAELIQHFRMNAAKVKQIQADVIVKIDDVPASLRGTLAIERPNRLRLKAGLLGVKEMGVDVGSNDELFWVWSRFSIPGQQSGIFFAKHSEYSSSALRQMIPIEPRWLIDSLGLIEFDASERHEGPFERADGRVEIRSFKNTPAGQTVRTTVIDPRFGYVCRQSLYDSTGSLIAYIDSTHHQYLPEIGVSLPRRIAMNVKQPGAKMLKMSIDASGFLVNSIYGDAKKLWTLPDPIDVPKFDLARMAPEVASENQSVRNDSVYANGNLSKPGWNVQQTAPVSKHVR